MPATFCETRVEEIWRDYLPGRTDLVTQDNEPLEIIYPGRRNDNPGADLCDAIINTSKGLLRGDVEIHINSSNWREHGHHIDPNYNRVILHVVYKNDTESGVVLQNGCKIPTLVLEKYVDTPSNSKIAAICTGSVHSSPCRHLSHQSNPISMGEVLDTAGLQRFTTKANIFRNEIAREGAGQTLYRGIMAALGYSRNKEPMTVLAGLVPLQNLEAIIYADMTDEEYLTYLQAKLLGTAGLLPSQRGIGQTRTDANNRLNKLEKIWADGEEQAQMSAGDWYFFKVRPGNYPTRRIAAMGHLLLRYRKTGLLSGLVKKVREVKDNSEMQKIEDSIFIPACRDPGEFMDFGATSKENTPALLGRERAADIVINVLLPFTAALANIDDCREEKEKARELYQGCPAGAENMVEKDMRQKLGINKNIVKTARRQQGLIHIYKTFCLPEKCHDCPVMRVANVTGKNHSPLATGITSGSP